jgi:hypothetical protein
MRSSPVLALVAAGLCAALAYAQLKEIKPDSSVDKIPIEQDIKIGQQASAEVPKQMAVIDNPAAQSFSDRIIKRLTAQPEAGEYPYSIKVVYDPSINAFAFPGGAMFIHTGLITAAENEDQVAGVLAHEVSHVALRHGMANMVKAQRTQTMAGIGGLLAGIFLGNTVGGQLAQMGIGLGAQSVILKNSREFENQADLLGARMMNGAGYNPIEMARFFEKLEEQSGERSKVSEWFASHPNPGNRVDSVEAEIQNLPRRTYNAANASEFQKVRTTLASLKAPPKPSGQPSTGGGPGQGGGGGTIGQGANGMRRYQGQSVAIDFPRQWEVFGNQGQPDSVTIAPRQAVSQNGNLSLGVILNQAQLRGDLLRSTQAVVAELQQSNRNMRETGNRRLNVAGREGVLVSFENGNEFDYLVTAAMSDRLFFAIFVTPRNQQRQAEQVFQRMIESIRLGQ